MDEMMGIRYKFALRDDEDLAVNAPEWLVPPQLLLRLGAANCLDLIRYERLPNAAARHMEVDRRDSTFRKMNVLNHNFFESKASS